MHQPNTRLHQQNSIKKNKTRSQNKPQTIYQGKTPAQTTHFNSCNTIYFFAPQLLFSKEQKNNDTQSNLYWEVFTRHQQLTVTSKNTTHHTTAPTPAPRTPTSAITHQPPYHSTTHQCHHAIGLKAQGLFSTAFCKFAKS